MFCVLILLPHVKNSMYKMTLNNSNTSSHNSESEKELPGFSTLKLFDMKPRENAAIKTVHSNNVNRGRFEQTEVPS